MRVAVIEERNSLARPLLERLRESSCVEHLSLLLGNADGPTSEDKNPFADGRFDTIVYSPAHLSEAFTLPNLEVAKAVFELCGETKTVQHLVVLSSALVYGAGPQNPGLISESRPLLRNGKNRIADQWKRLEILATKLFAQKVDTKLTILRPVTVLTPEANGGSGYFRTRVITTLPGHDPSIQVLSIEDLIDSIARVIETGADGIFNVAPDTVVPLRVAIHLAGARAFPIPSTLRRVTRFVLKPIRVTDSSPRVDYLRYSWTVSNKKIKNQTGFAPKLSSAQAVKQSFARRTNRKSQKCAEREFDAFGFDQQYLETCGRFLFNFLERYYWRVEVKDLDNLPRNGPVVLVGPHRGFMPWDGIILIHQLLRVTGRCPRFLMHPGLVRFPFLADFMTRIGGVIACQENADRILERGDVLGIFPEGVKAAFKLYRDAYRLSRFGRNDFVKIALRNQAPIVPFVTVGSAEIFPIVKRIEWSWWKRHTEWPCLPLTPTPLPLPAKWHTQFLRPIQLAGVYPPEAANDPVVVSAISEQVKSGMQNALHRILDQRKSIFYGSVFEQEAV